MTSYKKLILFSFLIALSCSKNASVNISYKELILYEKQLSISSYLLKLNNAKIIENLTLDDDTISYRKKKKLKQISADVEKLTLAIKAEIINQVEPNNTFDTDTVQLGAIQEKLIKYQSSDLKINKLLMDEIRKLYDELAHISITNGYAKPTKVNWNTNVSPFVLMVKLTLINNIVTSQVNYLLNASPFF